MKWIMKKKILWLLAILLLVCSLNLPGAMAYFTTYVTAKGSKPVILAPKTDIEEEFLNWTKHITLENTGEKECFVRVKAFAGSLFALEYMDETGKWSLGEDDFWYYSDIVPAGGSTETLLVKINVPEEYKDSFDVVVVQECAPVLYHEDGSAYADWDMAADTTSGLENGKGAE